MAELAGAGPPERNVEEVADWAALPLGVLAIGADDRIVRANPAARSLLCPGDTDVEPCTLVGQPVDSMVDPVDSEALLRCLALSRERDAEQRIRLPARGGSPELLLRFVPGRPGEAVVCVEDVAELTRSDPLHRAMQAVLDQFGGFVGVTDDRANVTYLNRAAREILGIPPDGVRGLRTTDMLHSEAFNRYYEEIRPALVDRGSWSGFVRLASEGEPQEIWGTVLGGVGDDGETIEWLAALTETEEGSAEAAELAHRANHDHLTGLANRSLFLDRLRLALLRRDRAHHPVTVAFIDLDGFKAVNDSAGHHVGDVLLRHVADRLLHLMRPTDTVARWGGDEFVVLCEDAGDEIDLAARLVVGIGSEPFEPEGHRFKLGATVGTAKSPPGPSAAEALVAAADAAMYRSKRSEEQPPGQRE